MKSAIFSIIVGLCVFSLSSPAAEEPAQEIIHHHGNPVELTEYPNTKLFILPITIHGKTCRMLVDTGASHTTMDRSFWDREFPEIETYPMQKTKRSNVKDEVRLAELDSINLQGVEITNTLVALVNLDHLVQTHGQKIDGIIGINHLGVLPVKFNFHQGSLQWLSPEQLDKETKYPITFFNNSAGLFYLNIDVDGHSLPFLMDSGASRSFFPKNDTYANTEKAPFQATFQGVNGIEKKSASHPYTKPLNLVFNKDFTLKGVEMIMNSTDKEGIFGIDSLQKMTIILDSSAKKLYVQPVNIKTSLD